jgi:hypothetical protein
MVTDSNAPTLPSQASPDSTAQLPNSVWAVSYSVPIDIKVNGQPYDFFSQGMPKRVRHRQPAKSPDGYLSRAEAAAYLGVSLRRLEGDSSVPKFNVARLGAKRATWRYRRADLDEWMAVRKHNRNSGRTD